MKKIFIFYLVVLFFSCGYKEYESVRYEAPNWTSDNKIVFIEVYWWQKYRRSIFGIEDLVDNREIGYLWEVNSDGTGYKRIAKLWDSEWNRAPTNTSSAGDWVVFAIAVHGYKIYRVKRDGSDLKEIGSGWYPDLSPTGDKLVYVKPGKGLWIMNIDGTNEHQIVGDTDATHPAWSSDGGRIAFRSGNKTFIYDTMGNIIDSLRYRLMVLDWGPPDSNAILCADWKIDKNIILYLDSFIEDTLFFEAWWWSFSGELFIGGTAVYKRNGTKLFRIKP